MATLKIDVKVGRSEGQFRNDLMRAYFSYADVNEMTVSTVNIPNGSSHEINFSQTLICQFDGYLLIQLQKEDGSTFDFSQKGGTLVLPTGGTAIMTNPEGGSTQATQIQYVAV